MVVITVTSFWMVTTMGVGDGAQALVKSNRSKPKVASVFMGSSLHESVVIACWEDRNVKGEGRVASGLGQASSGTRINSGEMGLG